MAFRTNHINPLTAFHKKVFRGFLHLSDRAPIPSLYFLTEELPMEARIHRDVCSLFFNIWSNPQAKIYAIANLAYMYDIEDPPVTLSRTPPKNRNTVNLTILQRSQFIMRSNYEKKGPIAEK